MQPYSEDLRQRAVQRAEADQTIREIAAALRISPSCVSKWRKRQRETGSLAPGRVSGHEPRALVGEHAEWLRARVAEGPFTARGVAAELAARGIETDRRAVWVLRRAEGPSFKETVLPAEQSRPDIACKRTRWIAHQGKIDRRRLVFIDEAWIKTNMAPLRGWGVDPGTWDPGTRDSGIRGHVTHLGDPRTRDSSREIRGHVTHLDPGTRDSSRRSGDT
jgi:transposase